MRKKLIVPAQDQVIYDGWHFSPGVRVGDTIYVSGQVGVNEKHEPADGIEAQARLAFQNLERVLVEAGATLGDVVEMTTFHINLQAEIAAFSKVKDEFFPGNGLSRRRGLRASRSPPAELRSSLIDPEIAAFNYVFSTLISSKWIT